MQVSDDSLDSSCVTFLRVVVEACDLADGKGNVRACVGGKVEEHAHNRWVAPSFIVWFAIGVDAKSQLDRWSSIWVAVNHSSCFNDSLDETFLR